MTAPVVLGLLAAILIVCYAHFEIPRFTRGAVKREVAHAVLAVAGIAFGAVCATVPGEPFARWAAFTLGFGAVHAPAASILFLKWLRGAGQS
ncbi:hypothetical protein [Paraburkholderia rhizosphaerae]|uniref:Uncharacterized protein n=1 Tax=Paraburkholderia rhizosphaerae TaxID=480658 RepID=A0A4V3HCJ2_9BURK|nr:hypothetical protein [Paraburkholderia rhizosphaerae]TDY37384.1 hypothetical protein BX592_13827 [Paraburkholderia rhizosphaerae]